MEKHRPSECEFCGCSEVARDGYPMIGGGRIVTFRCGTLWTPDDGIAKWWQDKIGCGGHVGELYPRIRRALNVLRVVDRYDTDGVDPDTCCGDEVAQAVDAGFVDQVIQILEGESDGKSD